MSTLLCTNRKARTVSNLHPALGIMSVPAHVIVIRVRPYNSRHPIVKGSGAYAQEAGNASEEAGGYVTSWNCRVWGREQCYFCNRVNILNGIK